MGRVETVVFLSLVLDLFAFTIPLPLFPRIIEWYTKREAPFEHGFLSRTLATVSTLRGWLIKADHNSAKWDVVLLGGIMGSVFSTLQFIVSPRIGALSDKHGRKNVLLVTMIGNILSALVWMQSTTFASYLLSRVIGGLSEGNVQLAIAILSDVTTPANRGKALAFVGIAFSICFCVGPPVGAYFASRPLPPAFTASGREVNIYAVPAAITLVLLVAETVFLAAALPETRGTTAQSPPDANMEPDGNYGKPRTNGAPLVSAEKRIALLNKLRHTHFLFLGVFSGVEFTLTFLTFDLFDWNNKQNGALLGSIGIISALLQGGYVRRAMAKVGESVMARRGVMSCTAAFALLAVVPHFVASQSTFAVRLLQAAAICMAFTSATVVTSLTALASLQCDEPVVDPKSGVLQVEHPQLVKGKALGQFRSSGQLGRAIGPLAACALYWTIGPSFTYAAGALATFALSAHMRALVLHHKSKVL